MVYPYHRYKVNNDIVAVSGSSPTPVVVAQSGFSVVLLNIQITNRADVGNVVTVYEESNKIIPSIPLDASGTFLWENPAGRQFALTDGSGVKVGTQNTNLPAEVGVQYSLIDNRTPISKSTARSNTFTNATTIRRPNKFGNQP